MKVLVLGEIFPGFLGRTSHVYCLRCHLRLGETAKHQQSDIRLELVSLLLCRRNPRDDGLTSQRLVESAAGCAFRLFGVPFDGECTEISEGDRILPELHFLNLGFLAIGSGIGVAVVHPRNVGDPKAALCPVRCPLANIDHIWQDTRMFCSCLS